MISGGDNPYDIHDAKLSNSATTHESSSMTAHEISNSCGIVVTRNLRWGGSRVGILVIGAGQLRRGGLRRDRDPIGEEVL